MCVGHPTTAFITFCVLPKGASPEVDRFAVVCGDSLVDRPHFLECPGFPACTLSARIRILEGG